MSHFRNVYASTPLFVAALLAPATFGAIPLTPTQDLVPREWFALAPVDARGRRPFRPDAVFARHLLAADAPAPRVGDGLAGETGNAVWAALEADEGGRLPGRHGYLFATLDVAEATYALARLQGASTLFVDGEGFAGDPYRFGFGGVPVFLSPGRHQLALTGSRGSPALSLLPLEEGLHLGPWDSTLPDLLVGREPSGAAGVLLQNVSLRPSGPLALEYGGVGPFGEARVDLPLGLAPLATLQVALPLTGSVLGAEPAKHELPIRVVDAGGAERLSATLELGVRDPAGLHVASYVSDVDGAAVEYALVPPAQGAPHEGPMHLALSLHGAGVGARGQAACYRQRPDFWIVAPTNRRPYGFDWQDWGRRDAYDVLALALAASGVDRRRVFVTGHSMGGHGTWHLAANDPDGFAGCAPSAGWESFDSYGGRPDGALRELWHAADAASRTLSLIDNLRQTWTYVLHGTGDRTVPAREALTMIEALTEADATFTAHMQGGAGHWWGNECMDWEPIFESFRGRELARDPERVDFTSVDPGVDARHHWVRVEQPLEYGRPLRVRGGRVQRDGIQRDGIQGGGAGAERIELTTENARLIAIEAGAPAVPLAVVDGTPIVLSGRVRPVWLERVGDAWRVTHPARDGSVKSAARSGPFKRAFDRRFLLVVGTAGDDERDAELLARARFDAGVWAYRAKGRADLATDRQFLAGDFAGRNVILYGNRDTNAAWRAVLPDTCPIVALEGVMKVAGELHLGKDLGAVFVYPRRGEEETLVGVFADTGRAGARLGYTLAPFVSGVGYPDYAVFGSGILRGGDGGVLTAGWFDADWGL